MTDYEAQDAQERAEAVTGIVKQLENLDTDELLALCAALQVYTRLDSADERGVVYRLFWWIGNGLT